MPVTRIRGGGQITDGTVPYEDIQNVAANTILGNNTASAARIQEIALAASTLLGRGASGNIAAITAGNGVTFSGTSLVLAAGYGDTINPYGSKTAKFVLAAPSGSAGVPTFRLLDAADIPALSYVTSVALAAGTTGTDVNISGSPITSSGTLTINIPSASATARGLVTTTNQTFAGEKSFTGAILVETSTTVANHISIKSGTNGYGFQGTGYVTISSNNPDNLTFVFQTGTKVAHLVGAFLTAARSYTLPNASGTLALTSDISTNYQAPLNGTGYVKMSGTTVSYVASIPNGDLANSSITVQGTAVSLGGSVNVINGTGFVKASGTTISYDNSTYYLASNPNGYISSYTETDTLATVTGRGASTTTQVSFNREATINTTTPGTTATYGLHFGGQATADSATGITFSAGQAAAGNANAGIYVQGSGSYGTRMYIATTDSYAQGAKTAVSINESGIVNFVRNRPTALGNTIWDAGNLTNLNQLTNGPGYITGYTETDTLATVTSRGNTANTQIIVSKAAHAAGADNYHLELYAPNSGNGDNEVSLRFHQGGVYYSQIRYNSTFGYRFTGGNNTTYVRINAGDIYSNDAIVATQTFVNNKFGAETTSGTLNWNDVTNTRPGTGYTLLTGTATNGPGPNEYFHAFNLEYSSKTGAGNVTQLAISYGTPGNRMYIRGRYDGTWTGWTDFLTNANYSGYTDTRYYTQTTIQNIFSGSSAMTGYNKSNWDTAFGWGNHASAGYITSASVGNGTLTLAVSGTGLSGSASFTANQSGNTTFTVTSNATSANTASTIVARDGSGNFTAGTITASGVSTTNVYDSTGTYNVNLGSGGSEGRGLVAGYSGSSYAGIGYNVRHTTTGGSWIAPGPDTASYLLFTNGGFQFYGTGTGTGGRSISWTSLATLNSSGTFNATNVTVNGNQAWHAGNLTNLNQLTNGPGYITAAQTYFIGTTQNALNRSSASQTLTGVSIDGDAGSVGGVAAARLVFGESSRRRGVNLVSNWNQTSFSDVAFLSSENNATNAPSTDFTYGLQYAFHRDGAAYRTQMVTSLYSDLNIWVRNSRDSDVWTAWKVLLHSGNYNSYAPTLTGGGASGTWGISITGNAATATSASSATLASTVTVGANNNTADWFPIVWHSGNFLYSSSGLAQIYPAQGYARFSYINTTDNDVTSITRFVVKNGDDYHRSATTTTAADVIRGVASGSWGINITGTAAQWGGYSLPTRTNWDSRAATDIVVGQLAWRHYGDSHTIVDVSKGTVPSGASVSNTDSQVAWTGTYPTLVGWNGTNTYGVRVDRARVADTVITETDTLASVTGRGATTASQCSFTKTDDHAISVGTIRGRAVGSQTGEYIHLYERVHIGSPNGWGAASATAPTQGLSVHGSILVSQGNATGGGIILADDGDIVDLNDAWCSMRFTSGVRIYSANRGGSAVIALSNGGTITASGDVIAYGSPSDANLKTIKGSVGDALEGVKKLNGYRFDWKNPDDLVGIKEDIGVIAQEVAEVFPELARTNANGQMSVRYQGLTAVLIEAVKEQQAQIEDLKRQIEFLAENK